MSFVLLARVCARGSGLFPRCLLKEEAAHSGSGDSEGENWGKISGNRREREMRLRTDAAKQKGAKKIERKTERENERKY